VLLNDEAFRIARPAGNPSIHVIFSVASAREPAFAILKVLSSVVPGERNSLASLERIQKIIRFPRRRPLDVMAWRTRLPLVQRRWCSRVLRGSQLGCMRSSLGRTCVRTCP
jgi:hypothetical protein